MRTLSRAGFAAAVAVGCTLAHSAAVAQNTPTARPTADRAVDVSVQYTLRLPLKTGDIDEQTRAMEQGRKLVYHLASGECGLLMATLASSCEVHRVNVSTNSRRQRVGEDVVTVSGRAQFKINTKAPN